MLNPYGRRSYTFRIRGSLATFVLEGGSALFKPGRFGEEEGEGEGGGTGVDEASVKTTSAVSSSEGII